MVFIDKNFTGQPTAVFCNRPEYEEIPRRSSQQHLYIKSVDLRLLIHLHQYFVRSAINLQQCISA